MIGNSSAIRDGFCRLGGGLGLCFLLTMLGTANAAQSSAKRTAYTLDHTVQWSQASAAGRQYVVSLAIPNGPAPKQGFPVITVLDASWSFATLVETARAQKPFLGPAVIVGIAYPRGEEKRRQFDLTIAVDRKTLPVNRFDPPWGAVGGADAFLAFLIGPVRHAVAARVPTDNQRQILLGHSLGGLFTLHTLFNHPGAFQAYVAGSPSIWFGDRAILSEMHSYIARISGGDTPRPLLLTVGGLEQTVQPAEDALSMKAVKPVDAAAVVAFSHCYVSAIAEVDSVRYVARLLNEAHADTSFVEFPGEDHMSVIPSYLSRGLRFALSEAWLRSKEGEVAPATPADLQPINLQNCARY